MSSKARLQPRLKPRKFQNKSSFGEWQKKSEGAQNQWLTATDFAPPRFGIKAKLELLKIQPFLYFAPPRFGIKAKQDHNTPTRLWHFAPPRFGIKAKLLIRFFAKLAGAIPVFENASIAPNKPPFGLQLFPSGGLIL
jgi:hypothetical protein